MRQIQPQESLDHSRSFLSLRISPTTSPLTSKTHLSNKNKGADGSSVPPMEERIKNGNKSMSKVKQFLCFPKLPAELQNKIWPFTFPPPETIVVDHKNHLEHPAWKAPHTEPQPNPIALQVHHNSRKEALRTFKSLYELPNGYRKYFDPDTDLIVIPHCYFYIRADDSFRYALRNMKTFIGAELIRRLVISKFIWKPNFTFMNERLPREMRLEYFVVSMPFPNLESITIHPERVQSAFFDYYTNNFQEPEQLKQCYDAIIHDFLEMKESFPGCKMPKITISGYELSKALENVSGEEGG
ncbi:hypothetical protein G7Y89_g6803 [Cudoniella acicularis]|uniref:2EXR domain-containing protein n=1 Tax=Cudoniella acicularis TaxID=354080 RepID=A0A8H4RKK4_9HELO|nr:hypothetical protein G7Y89_g6803 [Cudoniella acicularis]